MCEFSRACESLHAGERTLTQPGERISFVFKQADSHSREGWSVIFRHPGLIDRTAGKPGRRVRCGLGRKDEKAANRLIKELNELLVERSWKLELATDCTGYADLNPCTSVANPIIRISRAASDSMLAVRVRPHYAPGTEFTCVLKCVQ
jgi:hypothetical protein